MSPVGKLSKLLPEDPALPAVATLLGPEATAVIEAAVAPSGAAISSARPTQVRYSPSRSITVSYEVTTTETDGDLQKRIICARAGGKLPREAAIVETAGERVAVWDYRRDPYLPGMAIVTERQRLQALVKQMDVDERLTSIRVRTYRPGRRAVIELATASHRLFVRVVRPSKVKRIQHLHASLAPQVSIPRSLGWSDELGIVVLEALNGPTLRSVLQNGAGRQPPDGAALVRLLDGFPDLGPEYQAPPAPSERLSGHARLIGTVIADDDVAEMLTRLQSDISRIEEEPSVPIHGDFHSSQVIVDRNKLRGVVDIDTAGRGRRSADLATLLAHLYVLSLDDPGAAFSDYGRLLIGIFDTLVDPVLLRLQTAAAIVGYATGPFRVQQPGWPKVTRQRLAAALAWSDSAHAV